MPHRTIVLVQGFNSYPHTWNLGLCNTICSEPCCLLASCFCFPCANYSIRKTALNRDLSNYRCFQGYYCGILACCCPCQAECGSCCLLGESLLCPHVSVMSTRHLVQEKYNVRNTCCENCVIDSVICCECMMCFCGEDSCAHDILHCVAHLTMCLVMPCMQAQAYHQIKKEEYSPLLGSYNGAPPNVIVVER